MFGLLVGWLVCFNASYPKGSLVKRVCANSLGSRWTHNLLVSTGCVSSWRLQLKIIHIRRVLTTNRRRYCISCILKIIFCLILKVFQTTGPLIEGIPVIGTLSSIHSGMTRPMDRAGPGWPVPPELFGVVLRENCAWGVFHNRLKNQRIGLTWINMD